MLLPHGHQQQQDGPGLFGMLLPLKSTLTRSTWFDSSLVLVLVLVLARFVPD